MSHAAADRSPRGHSQIDSWVAHHRDALFATVTRGDTHVHVDTTCPYSGGPLTTVPVAAFRRALLAGGLESWPVICGCVEASVLAAVTAPATRLGVAGAA